MFNFGVEFQKLLIMQPYNPYIALITGGIELIAFIYFYQAFKSSGEKIKTLVFILLFLSSYQLLEAFNCMMPSNSALVRMSFVSITFLPALGVRFVYASATRNKNIIKYIAHGFSIAALVFIIYFITTPQSVAMKSCQSFFATYTHASSIYRYYSAYYQLGMLTMVVLSFYNLIHTENTNDRKLIADFGIGSTLFIIPSILITGFIPQFFASMPSVMCHIALILSIFIIKSLYREYKLLFDFGPEKTVKI